MTIGLIGFTSAFAFLTYGFLYAGKASSQVYFGYNVVEDAKYRIKAVAVTKEVFAKATSVESQPNRTDSEAGVGGVSIQ